jgi:FKBP-type peptidyl-prolyl cis-trans isomerase
MTNMQVTSTGIAVALAVIVALGMLFLGPNLFSPFSSQEPATTVNIATSTMQTGLLPEGELPTELTGADTVPGTGAEATAGSNVTVNYVGMLPDGTVFDASARHPETTNGFTFTLGEGKVIPGWDVGVQGMKEGGKRRLIIPPQYAYGPQGVPGAIPPNATLIFDIELLNVQ